MSQGSGIPPIAPGGPKPAAGNAQVVQIQSLPEALQNVSRAIRIEGEVVQQNRDGSIRVRTPQGDVDITMRGRQPQPGQKVEIEIPPGSPPRTANVRVAPMPPAQPLPPQTTTPQPLPTIPLPQTPVTSGPSPVTTTPQPAPPKPLPNGSMPPPTTDTGKPTQPPLPSTYQPTTQNAAMVKPAPPPVLVVGQIVQLTPITAPQAQTIISQMLASVTSPDSPGIANSPVQILKANIIAQNVPSDIKGAVLNAVQTGTLPSSSTPPQSPPAGTTQAPLNVPTLGTTPTMPSAAPSVIVPDGKGIMHVDPNGPLKFLQIDANIISIKLPDGAAPMTGQITGVKQNNTAPTTPMTMIPTPDGKTARVPGMITIPATVIGFTPQNTPMVTMQWPGATAPQTYILQSPAPNLVTGAQITLMPQTNAVSVTLPPTAAVLPKPLTPLMQALSLWPPADDIFQTFFQATPQAAQIFGRIVPSPANAAQFGPAALLFIAAAKAGDLQNWMGEKKLEMLQKLGKQGLLSRLAGEATQSSSGAPDSQGPEWRSYPLPLLWQNEISKIMLHVHHQAPEDESDNPEAGTRFIMDLDLERMGEVQLDGLVRGHRLDLIVRTKEAISYPMQMAMTRAYADALDGTNIYGEIGFQSELKNWMVIAGDETLGVSA